MSSEHLGRDQCHSLLSRVAPAGSRGRQVVGSSSQGQLAFCWVTAQGHAARVSSLTCEGRWCRAGQELPLLRWRAQASGLWSCQVPGGRLAGPRASGLGGDWALSLASASLKATNKGTRGFPLLEGTSAQNRHLKPIPESIFIPGEVGRPRQHPLKCSVHVRWPQPCCPSGLAPHGVSWLPWKRRGSGWLLLTAPSRL